MAYMHRIILLKGVRLVGFSHQYDYWSHATKYSIAWAFVCFPCCIKPWQSIKERIFINDNFFSHDAIVLGNDRLHQWWFKSWFYNWAVTWSDHLFGCWLRRRRRWEYEVEGEGTEYGKYLIRFSRRERVPFETHNCLNCLFFRWLLLQ